MATAAAHRRARPAWREITFPLDPLLMLATLGIMVCSLGLISVSTGDDIPGSPNYYVIRQSIFFAIGLVLCVVVSRIDYSRMREFRVPLYVGSLVLIFATWAFGGVTRGSRRAIQLPFFEVQSSELVKLFLIFVVAGVIVDASRDLGRWRVTGRVLGLALLPTVLVMLQPDLGSALVYVACSLTLLFLAGTPWHHLVALMVGGLAVIAFTLGVGPAVGVHLLQDYQVERLTSFLHPNEVASDEAYQQTQSRIAIGAGQRTGRGDLASQTELNFLPEAHTDFAFAVVGERWGFVGSTLVLTLYALLLWRGLRIMTMSKNLFGVLVAGGVVTMVLFQLVINVGMNIGIMPITGIPLPLLSYGGSSVLTTLLAIGLLQSIYAQGQASAATRGRVPI